MRVGAMPLEYEMKPSVNPIDPAMAAHPLYRNHHLPITPFVPFWNIHTIHTPAFFVLPLFLQRN
jgi:hypothetical protein